MLQRQLLLLVQLLCVAALPLSAWRTKSIYQLLTDRFAAVPTPPQCGNYGSYCGGTFAGIVAHLDYIQNLGFDAVWISPVVDNADGGYHGYWQRDMYTINAHFGGSNGLRSLSDALHARNMSLMVDIVANHASTADVANNRPFNLEADYHDCNGCSGCNVNDYHNLVQMEHCRLAGLRDFNNSDPNGVVATTLYAWIRDLVVNYTIDGLRIDTTPYVPQAVWQKFEAAAGVYAVGEVDDSSIAFVAPWQAPTGTQAALTGILSYPLFATMRSVFQQRNSMRQLGDAWRASIAAYANVGALGVFVDNHDNARFLNGANRDVGTFRAALAYAILSEGVPITYYGSEWLYAGGNDPGCREPLWCPGISYNASAAPLGPFFSVTNAYRRAARLWEGAQVERWQDDSLYAFSRGSNLVIVTNVGINGSPQSRAISDLPNDWTNGTTACNAYACGQCATVTNGVFITPPLHGADGVAVYDPSVVC